MTPDSGSINRLLGKISGTPFSWAYLGQNLAEHFRLRDLMPTTGEHISVVEGFHRSSLELRGHYLTYLYDIGRSMDSLRWWVSSVAYRNGVLSKTFHRICLLKLALDLIRSRESSETLVLVAPEPLWTALEHNLRVELELRICVIRRRSLGFFRPIRDVVDMVLHRIFFVARNGFRLIQARRAMSSAPQLSEPSTLILSWVTPDNLDLEERFHESFFGELAQKFQESGHSVALAPIFLWGLHYGKALKGIRKSPFPLVVPHNHLRFRNLLSAAAGTLTKPPRPVPMPSFRGLDIESLVNDELRDHWISNASPDALLVTALVRLWAATGVPINRFIYIYENQPAERALCWEVRRSYPNAQLVGYQHARTPSLLLNFHVAEEGESEAPLPDRIVTVGKHTAKALGRGGYAAGSIVVGGALQIAPSSAESADRASQMAYRTVLVASSDSMEEASELAYMAANLANEENDLQVILKCHPRTPYERISDQSGGQFQGNFQVSNEPILDLIRKSSVIVYSGSTVAVQALSLGIPAIHVIPQYDLDLDPLEGAPDIRLEACGLEDLRVKVAWMLENRETYIAQNHDGWRSFVDEMYGPVTEETIAAFMAPVAN